MFTERHPKRAFSIIRGTNQQRKCVSVRQGFESISDLDDRNRFRASNKNTNKQTVEHNENKQQVE